MERDSYQIGLADKECIANEVKEVPDAVKEKIEGHWNTLKDRVDYDGSISHSDANYWYRNGGGENLYADFSKLDLSGLYSMGDSMVGNKMVFNLLHTSASANDALVYGNITVEFLKGNRVKADYDIYDFDKQSNGSPKTTIRNIETTIGEFVAGKGQGFKIIFYGVQEIPAWNYRAGER